jgi:hypothetical protein
MIYQLLQPNDELFLEIMTSFSREFNSTDLGKYMLVYYGTLEWSAELSIYDVCECLMSKFNVDFPDDYHGRSMSVGDMLIIDGHMILCKSSGWQVIQ